jgi:aryl-alcohol dehydrogenase-like predicted oxidoreductase
MKCKGIFLNRFSALKFGTVSTPQRASAKEADCRGSAALAQERKQAATCAITRIAESIDEMAIGFALSPLQLLLHFVFVNMLNYVDRGVDV